MPKKSSSSKRTRGRPRSLETQSRILDVALRLLAEDGYSRMSLDDIAEAAGASKPTIYRRWSSKADLATAALRTIQLSESPVETGSTLGDLTKSLENFCQSLMRPNGMALIGTILAEESHTPELLALFRERLVAPRRAMLRTILDRAEKRKELRPRVNLDCTVNMLVGAFYARYLASSEIPPTFPRELAEIVWNGVAAVSSKATNSRK